VTLQLVHSRKHDLPPLWDGRRVHWTDWAAEWPTTMVFHGAEEDACTDCGWIPDRVLYATGRVDPAEGETFTVYVPRHTRSGRIYDKPVQRPAWGISRLHARRCAGCGLDQVTDMETWQVWDLEPADYTDAGSWPEAQQPQPAAAVQDALF
jgi:hypothetical protein